MTFSKELMVHSAGRGPSTTRKRGGSLYNEEHVGHDEKSVLVPLTFLCALFIVKTIMLL